MPFPVPDLARFLVGPWRIERRILDLRSGGVGRLTGEALFAPAPDGPRHGLRYEERGTLAFGAHRGEAGRGYRFAFDPAGAAPWTAEVRFEDGRPFHRLDLSSGRADVAHDCAPDRYRGRYRVAGRDRWTLVWLVRGPRKHALIATRYLGIAAGGGAAEDIPRPDGRTVPDPAGRGSMQTSGGRPGQPGFRPRPANDDRGLAAAAARSSPRGSHAPTRQCLWASGAAMPTATELSPPPTEWKTKSPVSDLGRHAVSAIASGAAAHLVERSDRRR